jgi:hypothetical protein
MANDLKHWDTLPQGDIRKLPPLFDNITDEELSKMSTDINELVMKVNALRQKQLDGGGLTDEEVKEGIKTLIEIRRARGAFSMEVPAPLVAKLEDLF